ncbi:hypothetical protein ACFLUP_01955 [Chloroflexota bacterium]
MPDYYFDIETNPGGQKPDFANDEILTIQFQRINGRTGQKEGDLTVLKSWESSEKDILEQFHSVFSPEDVWNFVPVGCNLSFDFFSLLYRWRRIGIEVEPKILFSQHPYIDIKSILVILNEGSFKGSNLGKFVGKRDSGLKVSEWYREKDYTRIQEYIEDEADRFIRLYQFFIQRLPGLWLEFAKESGITLT